MKPNFWPNLNSLDETHPGSLQFGNKSVSKSLNAQWLSVRMAGRFAALVAIIIFATSYIGGIMYYGWWLGMLVGWLPAVTLAWLMGIATLQFSTMVMHLWKRRR